DALGDVVAGHCVDVSTAACAGACLVDACGQGAALAGARLATAVDRLDATAIDFRLAGTATLVDANLDGTAETIEDGVWAGQLLVDGTWVEVAGTFSGAAN